MNMMVRIIFVLSSLLSSCKAENNSSSNVNPATPNSQSEVAGVDSNANGVRDDIDTKIGSYPIGNDQRQSVTQFARAVQSSLLSSTNKDSAYDNAVEIHRGQQCMAQRMPTDFSTYVSDIEASTMNTDQRVQAYIQFEQLIGGSVFPEVTGATCR
jgi:hypothetical protein